MQTSSYSSNHAVCPCCPNHCPLSDPQCGRGMRYVQTLHEGENAGEGVGSSCGQKPSCPHHGMHGHGPHPHAGCPSHDPEGREGLCGSEAVPHPGPHGKGLHGPGCPHHGMHGHGPHPHADRPPWDPENEEDLSVLLGRCGHFLYHRPAHGRGQKRILKLLTEQKGGLTQKELQSALGVQSGSLSEILSKLEARGLLVRERDEADRRCAIVKITEEGQKRLEQKSDPESGETLFSVLSDEEQETLKALLKKLLSSWHSQH